MTRLVQCPGCGSHNQILVSNVIKHIGDTTECVFCSTEYIITERIAARAF